MTGPITLYQFPISHFCEKARWVLDYKGLAYQSKNLLPGFHIKSVKKVAAKSSVPILLIDGEAIQGSPEIIDYLDQHRSGPSLTPENPAHAAEAMDWERLADSAVGPQVRMLCYDIVLEYPAAVISRMTQGGSMVWQFFTQANFPQTQTANAYTAKNFT